MVPVFLEDIQSDGLNLFMVFYTAFKNWTDLSRKLEVKHHNSDIKQQNYHILYIIYYISTV